jgi:hypothetical protein
MDAECLPTPGQLLCIHQLQRRLYAEAIQMTTDGLCCWVRPLALVQPPEAIAPESPESPETAEALDISPGKAPPGEAYTDAFTIIDNTADSETTPETTIYPETTEPHPGPHPGEDADLESIIDLRCASDLILPLSLFRVVWDTEFIPLYMQLEATKDNPPERQFQQQCLRQFIHALWKNYPAHFRALKRS